MLSALNIIRFGILALTMASTVACGQTPLPPCYVHLPVYDAVGAKLNFEIVAVKDAELRDRVSPNFLGMEQVKYRMVAVDDRLYFPEWIIGGSRLEVHFKSKDGARIVEQFVPVACRQRASVRHGILSTEFDVIATEVRGRLAGCDFDGDWWIRATALFGGQSSEAFEGLIEADGSFTIHVVEGRRHIFVVGKDKDPRESFAFNVVEGSIENDVGSVDLAGDCP